MASDVVILSTSRRDLSISYELLVFSLTEATAAQNSLQVYTTSATFLTNLQSADTAFNAASSLVVTSSPSAVAATQSSSDKLSTGAFIGVSVGVFVLILIGVGVCTNLVFAQSEDKSVTPDAIVAKDIPEVQLHQVGVRQNGKKPYDLKPRSRMT